MTEAALSVENLKTITILLLKVGKLEKKIEKLDARVKSLEAKPEIPNEIVVCIFLTCSS